MSESDISQRNGNFDPLVGKVLSGRFELERLLSRGGMGKVYRALQKPLDRQVALKILDVTDGDGEFRRRFFMEASLCAKLTHPHTVRIYDYGATDDGIFFIAMEYLQGRTLHDMIHMDAPIDPLRAVIIMRRICGALAEAHQAGIIHRDLKPANVFLVHHGDDPEFPKVIDFGLVKEMGKESELSRTGHVLGSPMYMAPEQVEGKAVDGRTDVYAIGLMLYFMLTGKTAFPRGNPMAVLMAQVQRVPPTFHEVDPHLEVPEVVEWLVRTCIEKKMEDRFGSMHELLRGLKVVEKVLRGDMSGPVELTLEDGVVVLPEGLDVSEDIRMSQLPQSTSLPPPTPLSNTVGGPPSDTTLHKDVPAPEQTSRTQVMLVAGSGLAMVGGIATVLVVGLSLIGLWAYNQQNQAPIEAVPPAEQIAQVQVRVTSEPSGAEVERDGVLIGSTPLSLTMAENESSYTVTVTADGHEARKVQVGPQQTELHVPLAKMGGGTAEPDPVPAPVAAPKPAPSADPKPAPAPAPVPVPADPTPKPKPGNDLRDPWADK